MFKAGILADGELRVSDEGVPQGSICSPVLANIYAHYVVDLWFEEIISIYYDVKMCRYADDSAPRVQKEVI
jgi:retron-type reverse transcriptase